MDFKWMTPDPFQVRVLRELKLQHNGWFASQFEMKRCLDYGNNVRAYSKAAKK